jgi:chromosome segregation ATPase
MTMAAAKEEHDTTRIPAADPMRIVEQKIDRLTSLVMTNANASLTAHEEHRKAFSEVRAELDDLRGKVERGSASTPPLTTIAKDAARQASSATLEVAAVEGRTLAAVSELATKVAGIEKKAVAIEEKTDAQTAMLTTISDAVTTVTKSELAKRVAKTAALLFLGWAATKGLHL